jgi:mannobiose 2-epimerase
MIPASALRPSTATAWPLAGSDAFARVSAEWRHTTAARLERILRQHVLEPWFPRTIDRELGGFATDFDRRWRPLAADDRMLEYQARTMRSAARIGQALPDRPEWTEYARHGAAYLTGTMQDTERGGFFWLVGRDGHPRALGTKHAHSTAYVISAFVELYRLTRDAGALDVAQRTFDWLTGTLHDAEHGGFHVWAARDGSPILKRDDVRGWLRDDDPLGHGIGLKDLNVHSDLLDSLRLLYAERPTAATRDIAIDLLDIVQNHFTAPDGRMYYLLERDLTPVQGPIHSGYVFQSAYRSMQLAQLGLGVPEQALDYARRTLPSILSSACDQGSGGVVDLVGAPTKGRKAWWVQLEAMHALLLVEVNVGDGSYRRLIDRLLQLVEAEFVDEKYGGLYEFPRTEQRLRDRLRPSRLPKAYRWKDPSHETELCISGIQMLRGLHRGAAVS